MKVRALIVGGGKWATRLRQILYEKPNFDVSQVSARNFIDINFELTSNERFDIGVCATSPKLQEVVAPQLVQKCKHLWLEKPISHSLDSGRQLLREITTDRTSFALINFSWLFSSVWEKFESLNLKVSDAATIEISQKAKEHTHKYIDAIEDYGSHDIALIYNWIKSNKKSTRELTIGNIEKSSFYATYDNLKIFWRVDFGQSKRNMNWLITWKDGSKTHIDFYGGSIVHDELELEFEKQDNINSFVSALFAKNQSLRRTNHEIALMTKEFFSKK